MWYNKTACAKHRDTVKVSKDTEVSLKSTFYKHTQTTHAGLFHSDCDILLHSESYFKICM